MNANDIPLIKNTNVMTSGLYHYQEINYPTMLASE